MEPCSVVLSAITLGPVIIQTYRAFRRVVKSVKHAPRELLELTNEMETFADLYDNFVDVCLTKPSNGRRAPSAGKHLVAWTKKAFKDFDDLLSKVKAVDRNSKYDYSAWETLTAIVNWLFSKNTVERLRASLSLARQNMVGFTNIQTIKRLEEQLAFLKSILTVGQRLAVEQEFGMTVDQRIRQLQDKISNRHLKQVDISERLQEAQAEVAAHREQSGDYQSAQQDERLFRLSESVERYVNHALPVLRKPSSSRRKGSTRSNVETSSQSTAASYIRSGPSSTSQPAAVPDSPPTSPEPPDEDLPSVLSLPEGPRIDPCAFEQADQAPETTITGTTSEPPSISHPLPTFQTEPTDYEPIVRLHNGRLIFLDIPPRRSTESLREISHQSTSEVAPDIPTDPPQQTADAAEIVHDDELESEQEDVAADSASEDEVYEYEKEEQKPEYNIFRPAAGTPGNRPRNWDKRHKRGESPQDFWHRKPWERRGFN